MTDTAPPKSHPLSDVVARITPADDATEVSIGDIVHAAGEDGILPLVFVPALIAATPLSGIPGLSAICGLLVALFSAALILGLRKVHLPRRLERKTIDADKLGRVMQGIKPVMAWIDRHTGRRLSFLFHRPVLWVPQLICLFSGLAMPFLELIPFSASIVASGVCLLVISMLTRDGLVFLLALLPYAAGGALAVRFAA